MDFFSHLFWSAIVFRSYGPLWLPIFFGAFPDIFSWGVWFFHMLFTGKLKWEKPDLNKIPKYAWQLYGVTHSIFVFAAAFAVAWILNGGIFIPMLAWLLHILMDIPTHSREFLPTPFLWPVSDYKFPGIMWGEKWFIALNWISIIFSIVYLFVIKGTQIRLF